MTPPFLLKLGRGKAKIKSGKKRFTHLFPLFLWAHLESNQAPTDYESVALTE